MTNYRSHIIPSPTYLFNLFFNAVLTLRECYRNVGATYQSVLCGLNFIRFLLTQAISGQITQISIFSPCCHGY